MNGFVDEIKRIKKSWMRAIFVIIKDLLEICQQKIIVFVKI